MRIIENPAMNVRVVQAGSHRIATDVVPNYGPDHALQFNREELRTLTAAYNILQKAVELLEDVKAPCLVQTGTGIGEEVILAAASMAELIELIHRSGGPAAQWYSATGGNT